MNSSKFLILGANGQLGKALSELYPDAVKTDIQELDITDVNSVANYDWSGTTTIFNAAAYTDVDGAETPEGKAIAREVNDKAVANLAVVATEKNLLLVHLSTDYVFDGSKGPHKEDEPFSPLGVYGKTKAAGDIKAAKVPKHYIVRTSWMIGDGKNFVRTMLELGKKGLSPTVVADQIGRPTFTNTLVQAISHLLTTNCQYGTYNISNGGEPINWADLTREIFKQAGYNLTVVNTMTAEYFAGKGGVAPRPLNSMLDLGKIEATGFKPVDWKEDLKNYISNEKEKS